MDRLRRTAPLSGLAFALIFGLGSGLWAIDQPAVGAGPGETAAFYEGASTRIVIGGSLSVASIPLLVWFGAVLRNRLAVIAGADQAGAPALAFAGCTLAAAVGLGAETFNIAGALAADDGRLSGSTSQIYFDLSYALGGPAAGAAFAMVALSVSIVSLASRALVPPWPARVAFAAGIVLLAPVMLWKPAFLALYALTILGIAALSLRLYAEVAATG